MDLPNTTYTALCTWELGSQLGHLARLSAICRALEQRGHRCFAALKDLSRGTPFFFGTEAALLQSPIFLPKISMQRPVVCLADAMLLAGYLKPEELLGQLQAWRNLILLIKPDVLIMDYSPTAALAALDIPCKKVLLGTGFSEPAPGHPMGDWNPYGSQPELLQRQERMVVDTINAVQARIQGSAIHRFSDLYKVDRTILNVTPDFDLYNDLRKDTFYHCHMEDIDTLETVKFESDKRRVLAYLNPGHPQFEWLIEGLATANAEVVVVCPRCNPKKLQQLSSAQFRYRLDPINLVRTISQADIVVNHGNAGSTMNSLMLGKPVLAIPTHLEQLRTAIKLDELELGRHIQKVESPSQVRGAINSLLTHTAIQKRTTQYALQHKSLIAEGYGEYVAEECDRMMVF